MPLVLLNIIDSYGDKTYQNQEEKLLAMALYHHPLKTKSNIAPSFQDLAPVSQSRAKKGVFRAKKQ